ncbi:MAG: hypothetical protein WB566_10725 [Terriglobales bacterium]
MASLYPHSTPQAWQQNLTNREVSVNGITAGLLHAPQPTQDVYGEDGNPCSGGDTRQGLLCAGFAVGETVPTGLKLGLGGIRWHTFRHTYRAWLDETGAPVGVQQKLMRHAHVSTTMDQYGNASALAKRKANRPIVQRLLQRPANQEVSIQ